MTLKQWFAESEKNVQAIYDAKNGRRYVYTRNCRLTKFAANLQVEQVVELEWTDGLWGAWLY